MSTVTVSRPDVAVEEVSAVLRRALGARYKVTLSMKASGFGAEGPGDATTILVASSWLELANVSVIHGANSTEIHVRPGATYFGLIRVLHRAGLAHKVFEALEHAFEPAATN
jgi:hypothetical protein